MSTLALRTSANCPRPAVWLALAAALWCGRVADAQNINQLRAIVGNNAPTAAELKVLDDAFAGFFAKFKKGEDLPNLRREYTRIVRPFGETPGHKRLNSLAITQLKDILGRGYPTPVKYNALLMIGDLNASDEMRKVKPLPEAYQILMLAFNLPPEPRWDYLKPAALIGLERFAEYGGIPQQDLPKLTEKLLALLADENPPAGRSGSAHNFLRRGAASVLAAMGSLGPDNKVVNTMASIAADPKARPTMRCEMARFIGDLNFPPNSDPAQSKKLANILGHLAVDICQQQVDQQAAAAGPDSSYSDGTARQMAMYVLDACTDTLQKLSGTTEDKETRDFVYGIKKRMDGLYRQLDDTDATPDDAVVPLLESEIVELQALLLEKPKPEPLAGAARAPATARAGTN